MKRPITSTCLALGIVICGYGCGCSKPQESRTFSGVWDASGTGDTGTIQMTLLGEKPNDDKDVTDTFTGSVTIFGKTGLMSGTLLTEAKSPQSIINGTIVFDKGPQPVTGKVEMDATKMTGDISVRVHSKIPSGGLIDQHLLVRMKSGPSSS